MEKYRDHYCVFNDDIQGTAAVAVAGLLASLKLLKTRLSDHTILFQGAGEVSENPSLHSHNVKDGNYELKIWRYFLQASLGIAQLCVMAMQKEGTSEQDAKDKIWMVDSKGLIVNNRPEGGVDGHKKLFAKNHEPIKELSAAVKKVKPSILIGRYIHWSFEIFIKPVPTLFARFIIHRSCIASSNRILMTGGIMSRHSYRNKNFFIGELIRMMKDRYFVIKLYVWRVPDRAISRWNKFLHRCLMIDGKLPVITAKLRFSWN